jgi:hypothetical protein
MRFRTTLILLILLLGLGAYLYFVELPKAAEKEKKSTLYDVEEDQVTSLGLAYADREIALTKEGDSWRMTKPVDTAGDGPSIENLIKSIVTAEVKKELEGTASNLASYGLEPPFVTVTIGLAGDKQPPKLLVGNNAPVGGSAYALREGDQAVLLTTSSLRYAADKQPKDLRDKKLLDFKDEDIRTFEIQRPGSRVKVERKDAAWEVSPGSHQGDESAVTTYLSSLRSLRAAEFPDDKPSDLSPYGLDEPQLDIVLHLKDDRKISVRFGTQLPSKNVYVHTSELPGVYEVGEYAYRNLDKSAPDLRDKTILTFAAEDLQAAEVTRDTGPSYKLSRTADGWAIDGVEGTPKADAIQEWIGDLSELKGFEIMADDVQDRSLYGLDKPRLRIALTGKDGKPLGTVLLGQLPTEQLVDSTAMLEDGSTVYKVRSYVFTRLNREPSALIEAAPSETPAATPADTAPGA